MSLTRLHRLFTILAVSTFIVGCAATPHQNWPPAPAPTEEQAATQPVAEEPSVATQPAEDMMTRVNTLLPAPSDFAQQRIGTEQYPIPPYAAYLKGVKICIDPGHGGQPQRAGYKRGPTGVREAEMNLRIAQYLRDLLTHCGAEVRLTRNGDVDLSLKDRAETANEWGADLFISCHHNAIDNKPNINRTTVWYHGDVDLRPSDLDLARYLCQGLLDGLALPQITGVPLKSDNLMYPHGFGVLRAAKVTAALTESSFFTNPEEEQRLRDPEYNFREAYSLFIGLARYAFTGLPKAQLIEPADGCIAPGTRMIRFQLDDGLRGRESWGFERQMIISDSIAVRLDGVGLPHEFRNEGYILTATLPDDLTPGEHEVRVYFENMYKNAVLNPYFTIEVTTENEPTTAPATQPASD